MSVYFTSEFIKNFKKLKGKIREEIENAIDDIAENPEIGKPLRYSLKGLKSHRVENMRIIYTIEVMIFISLQWVQERISMRN